MTDRAINLGSPDNHVVTRDLLGEIPVCPEGVVAGRSREPSGQAPPLYHAKRIRAVELAA